MKKSMKRSLRIILVAALAVFLCAALSACGGGTDSADLETISTEDKTTIEETTTAAAASSTIGKKTDATSSFLVTNKTGKDIVSFVVRSSQEESNNNLLESKDVFKKNETRMVFCEFPKGEPQTEAGMIEGMEAAENTESAETMAEISEGAKDLPVECVVDLELADGTKFTLHSFPEDITKGEIYLEGGIGYLVYKHEGSGESISTLMAEKAIADSQPETESTEETKEETTKEEVQEQINEEPVNQEPVQEQPVQEQPVQEQPVQEQPVNTEPAPVDDGGNDNPAPVDDGGNGGGNEGGNDGGNDGGNEGGNEGGNDGGNGGGNDDGCIDDGLFY